MSVNLKITGLHPKMANAISAMKNELKARHLPFEIFHSLRSHAHQQRIYEKGRTILSPWGVDNQNPLGQPVTDAPAFMSDHEYGFAVDFVLKNPNWSWDYKNHAAKWQELGALGKSLGLKWGGDWKGKDYPHFYLKRKRNMEEIRHLFFRDGIDAVWEMV